MNTGEKKSLSATAYFDDGSALDVTQAATWFSSNPGVADVTTSGTKGEVTALTPGNAVIQALYTDHGISQIGGANITVISPGPTLDRLEMTPASADIGIGANHPQQLTVTAYYSDGSSKPVTNLASYTSSDNASAMVSGTGLVSGVYHGDGVVITASYSDGGSTRSAQSIVNVKNDATSLRINPDEMTLRVAETKSFTVDITFDDGDSIHFTRGPTVIEDPTNRFVCINTTAVGGKDVLIVNEAALTATGNTAATRNDMGLQCALKRYFDGGYNGGVSSDFMTVTVTN
jgi:hypothetical protein